ncbi:MAG: hypothetical protein HN742_29405 [Lentisphaerae bacterium]|nr:hypothetical protein [Lentisphaerota bacterium]MBT4821318.1 hypothetical protein [Lentisphaerota bacterium]MBT5611753.1 hypothetical protein [Lentisphaerota bacterium]MBT7055446.1 hypothetical protein [Lentisphaerota bacterium]MBT7846025.1 hypothetical protein [Lentisphaerota bacterium]
MISSVAVTQMESDPEEGLVERAEEYEELQEEQKKIDDTLKEMLPKIQDLEVYKAALAKLEKILEELRKKQAEQLSKNKKAEEELKKLREAEKKLRELIAKLEKQKKELEAAIAKLEEELQKRKLVIDAPTVCVMPAKGKRGRGSAAGSDPVFVEAGAKGIVLDPSGKRTLVPTSKLSTDPAFRAAVDAIAKDEKKVMLFLIREDGYSAYRTAERFARTNSAPIGKLPIIGKGKLDLSRF